MAVSNIVPAPIPNLSPNLLAGLKQKNEDILAYIIDANSVTTYFREAPTLSGFRTAHQDIKRDAETNTVESKRTLGLDAFTRTVPLSSYEDYRPFISRFMTSERLLSDVSNLLAPGIPSFVLSSSGTSGGAAKFFLKYRHPPSTSPFITKLMTFAHPASLMTTGTYCIIFSLRYSDVLDVVDDGATDRKIVGRAPLCLGSGAAFRMYHGWKVENDSELMMVKAPNTTSPLAICFIHSYRTNFLMHALFALEDRTLEMINTLFCTFFFDVMRLIEEQWDLLIQAIEDGIVPHLEGAEEVYPYIQAQFKSNPARANELRDVGNDTTSPGWARRLWPNLQKVLGNASGVFSRVVPQVRHYIGPSVSLQSIGYMSSEAWLGEIYDPRGDLNLYKTLSGEFFEYLEVSLPEDAFHLKRAWEIEAGKTYELILTTRDGFWRYRLGDIIEVAGFDPEDGQPIIRYSERRSAVMRASTEIVTEKELLDAVHSLVDTLEGMSEFTVIIDERSIPRTYGFLIELKGTPGPKARSAPSRLQDFLSSTNDTFKHASSSKHIGIPTVRLLAPGTFRSYREWRTQVNPAGGGQVKVPIITLDGKTITWLLERIVEEI